MLLEEAKSILEEHGYIVEYTKDEYDAGVNARDNKVAAAQSKAWDDPSYKKLHKRHWKEMGKYPEYYWDYKNLKVPGKKPGTMRNATTAEKHAAHEEGRIKRKEINDRYTALKKQMFNKLQAKYEQIIEDEDMTLREYEAQCKDWCIINWFSAPGCGYQPVIVQKGYKSKEECEKDLAKFKEWAWTEVDYTDVESQCYRAYPTEIIEEMGIEYEEKKVPEGKAPEFKAHPYYTTNYWGD